MVLHRPVELARIVGKLDGSGVSGSTGRGRSQALESKVRFADHSPRIALMRYTVGQRVAWPLLRARHPGM
jgi:hypothetical protein